MPDNRKSSRRDFLKGKSAVDSVRADASSLEISVPNGLSEQQSVNRSANYVEQYSKNAMACEFELMFNMHQYPQSGTAAMAAFQLIDQLESQMTVYRADSEISLINQTAFKNDVVVESELFELLLQSRQLFEETGGAFDITSGPLSKLWGFDKRTGSLPEEALIAKSLQSVGMEKVKLVTQSSTIRFTSPNVEINLNGIGKGHALDRVVELFEKQDMNDFVIHGGQSSVVARGSSTSMDSSNQQTSEGAGWSVGVSHPTLPGVRLGEVRLRNQALGTSGTARQGFFHNSKRYGHVIDPRTGWPSSHFLSSTVVSNLAARSDALATAFFVMTLDEVADYCQSNPECGTILVEANPKSKSQVTIHTFNLNDDSWIEN